MGVVRGYVVIRVRLTLQAESVATGTVAISLPSPQTCEGRERREPREPQGSGYLSDPSKILFSSCPTRIGLTYPQCHRRPYSSYARRTGRVGGTYPHSDRLRLQHQREARTNPVFGSGQYTVQSR